MEGHRSGKFKQANKKHNHGKHKSKGLIKKVKNGKVGKPVSSKQQRKLDSRQKIIQSKIITAKKEKLMQIPLITFIMIDELSNAEKLEFCLTKNYHLNTENIADKFYNLKINAPIRNQYKVVICNTLDAKNISNIVSISNIIFLVSSVTDKFKLSSSTENLLTVVLNMSCGHISHVYQNPFGLSHKNVMGFKNSYERVISRWIQSIDKFNSVDSPEDLNKLFLLVSRQVINPIFNTKRNSKRSVLLLENVDESEINKFNGSICKYACNPMNKLFCQNIPEISIEKVEKNTAEHGKKNQDINMESNIVLFNSATSTNDNSLIKVIEDLVVVEEIGEDLIENNEEMDTTKSHNIQPASSKFDGDLDDENETFAEDIDGISEDFRFRDDWNDEDEPSDDDNNDFKRCPYDITSRERFLKYRGLENFYESEWEGSNILPEYYSNVYQFKKSFKTIRLLVNKFLESTESDENIEVGHSYSFKLNIMGDLLGNIRLPFIMPSLHEFEDKFSHCNISLKRVFNCDLKIKSKDELLFSIGYRYFYASPLFSELNLNKKSKNKFERYMPTDGQFIATLIAPINLLDEPVTLYKKDASTNKFVIVASGSIIDYDNNKLVIKRTILTGRPYRIRKNLAIISHMFHHRSDVEWFKPVELVSTNGKRGYIKNPLGTHGTFKCIFDRPLDSSELVYMHLYKRVFPKFTFKWMPSDEQLLF